MRFREAARPAHRSDDVRPGDGEHAGRRLTYSKTAKLLIPQARGDARVNPASAADDVPIATIAKNRHMELRIINVWDMPALQAGAADRREINAPLLVDSIFKSYATLAYCELVTVRPGEVVSSSFSFGRSRGLIEGILTARDICCLMITPASWHRIIGIPLGASKDVSRDQAIRRWTGKADLFRRVKDGDEGMPPLSASPKFYVRGKHHEQMKRRIIRRHSSSARAQRLNHFARDLLTKGRSPLSEKQTNKLNCCYLKCKL